MIEKQNPYQLDYEMDEKDRIKSRPLVTEVSLERKMIHIEVTGEDGTEMQVEMDNFPSPKILERDELKQGFGTKEDKVPAEVRAEPKTTETKVDVVQKSKEEYTPDNPHKEMRPQSLNLGRAEFVYETKTETSNIQQEESDEDNNTSGKEVTPTKKPGAETWSEPLPEKIKEQMNERSLDEEKEKEINKAVEEDQEKPVPDMTGSDDAKQQGTDQPKEALVKAKSINVNNQQGDLDSINGPTKDDFKRKSEIKFEVTKIIMIDNSENEEEPENENNQRMEEFVPEKKISNIEPEGLEEVPAEKVPKKTKGAGHVRTDITRIVPLKPEKAKSQEYQDDIDIVDKSRQVKRHFKRHSMYESLERQFDPSSHSLFTSYKTASSQEASPLSMMEAEHGISQTSEQQSTMVSECLLKRSTVQDEEVNKCPSKAGYEDLSQSDDVALEVLMFPSKNQALAKSGPPTPPVKTKKARESGLILRNSRNTGKEPAGEALRKQHGVTVFSHWSKASHELSVDLRIHHVSYLLLKNLFNSFTSSHEERGWRRPHRSRVIVFLFFFNIACT